MRTGLIAVCLVVLVAGSGFGAGWLARSMRPKTEVEQKGTFSLDLGEEKKVTFPRPFTAVPHLDVEESDRFFKVTEVQAGYFKVKAQPNAAVSNQPWKAIGMLAD